jgi:predicted Fe-S protein YdhL (DUF1289 family)
MSTLADFMREEEARLIAETRVEVAREMAAWEAMTPEEQAKIIAAREARFADVPEGFDGPDEDEDDEPCPEHRRPLSMCPDRCR